jgi:hypothetical protein
MKDFLTPQNIKDIDPEPEHEYKFVRFGNHFVYGQGELHVTLASIIPAITYANKNLIQMPVVDDAGAVAIIGKKIAFFGSSSSCYIPGDEDQARTETRRIAAELFGIEVLD